MDVEQWTVFGIPAFITKQLDPGTVIAFTMVYEPTKKHRDRYRISAAKVVGVGEAEPERAPVIAEDLDEFSQGEHP